MRIQILYKGQSFFSSWHLLGRFGLCGGYTALSNTGEKATEL